MLASRLSILSLMILSTLGFLSCETKRDKAMKACAAECRKFYHSDTENCRNIKDKMKQANCESQAKIYSEKCRQACNADQK